MGGFGVVDTVPAPSSQEAFVQETAPPLQEASHEMIFDPFAEIPPQPQTQTTVPTSPDLSEFSPQPMAAPAPKPAAMGLLPPPPTKQSVKAANRMKINSGSASAVTLPLATVEPSATTTTPQTAPSDGKKIPNLHPGGGAGRGG